MSLIIKAFRWYGGKIRLVHIIRHLIPPHLIYIEPFMGSAALLLNHARSDKEILNDMDKNITCFMKTLADSEKGKKLEERLKQLHLNEEIFKYVKKLKESNYKGLDDIECSVNEFILVSQSRDANRKTFSSKGYKNDFDYCSDINFHIPKVRKRLQNVEVMCGDGIELMETIVENPDAFAFLDPPYRHKLRGKGADKIYGCELSEQEHIRLLETIKDAQCKIMLCGYRSKEGVDLYDKYLFNNEKWRCYKLANLSKAPQNKKKKDYGEEFIWVNYDLPDHARKYISLKQYSSL